MTNLRKNFSARWVRFMAVLLVLCSVLSLAASAEGTSNAYTYNYLGDAVESAAGYLVDGVYKGSDFGTTDLQSPQDMYVRDNCLYILDSGNSRILKLSSDFKLIAEIKLKDENGQEITFANAAGIFVNTNGDLYVSDQDTKVVYIAHADGAVYRSIEAPSEEILGEGFDYRPSKVLVDSAGVIYVLSKGTGGGALQFDNNLNFMGFYGSEKVVSTPQVIATRIWRKFLTKKQQEAMAKFTPSSYTSFDLDTSDFVYTVRDQATSRVGQVRKLNASGKDILLNGSKTVFGDLKKSSAGDDTLLTDIEVDDEGFITLLDERRGRIFQYDQSSQMLFAFGGKASQKGTFKEPAALESLNGNIVVLDSGNNNITVFKPTDFALNVRKAVLLFDDGKYQDAIEPWEKVLQQDSRYEIANTGMGKALMKLGNYQEAMRYFKLGESKQGYSDAFTEYRNEIINQYFPLFMLGIILLIGIPMYFIRRSTIRIKNEYTIKVGKYRYPLYCMAHPFKGYGNLKEDKKGSLPLAIGILGLYFLISIFARQATGFIFNTNRVDQFNIFVELTRTVGMVLIFTIANWAVSTIMDGEGTYREIFIFTAYALTPYIIGMIPVVLFSNFAVIEEGAFYTMLLVFVEAWTAISILMAIKEAQQFTLAKTIWTILLTFLGIVLVFSILAIIYSMFMQMISWVTTIINELLLRS